MYTSAVKGTIYLNTVILVKFAALHSFSDIFLLIYPQFHIMHYNYTNYKLRVYFQCTLPIVKTMNQHSQKHGSTCNIKILQMS